LSIVIDDSISPGASVAALGGIVQAGGDVFCVDRSATNHRTAVAISGRARGYLS
jgi:hypothetical protein